MQNSLPNNWQATTLGGTASLNYGKGLPETIRSEGEVPVYGSSGISGYHNQPLVQEEGYIVGRKGTVGTVYYSSKPFYPIDTVYYSAKSDIKCNFKFFYYLLKNLKLNKLNSDSAVPGLNRDTAYAQPVLLPTLPEQERIASILYSFDDKIELNNKISKTLEEMAQAIFKEWFIEFRFPGWEKVKFVDSELGKIPEGWSVRQFGDIVHETRNSIDPKNLNAEIPYLGIEHLPKKSLLLSEWGCVKDVVSTKLCFNKGDILFGKIRPYFHKVIVAPMDGVCSADILVMKPIMNKYFGIALSYAFSDGFVNYASISSQGTNMPRAKWEALTKYPIIVPDNEILNLFNQLVISSINKIENIIVENEKLMDLRDLLLPKLMKGEIRIV